MKIKIFQEKLAGGVSNPLSHIETEVNSFINGKVIQSIQQSYAENFIIITVLYKQ